MILPDTNTILIVDDDRGGREALEALLLTQGYTLILASNGPDALRKLSESAIDLVLLDVMMPVMDGYEVCRRIRSNPAMADIPVLMLTALNDYRSRLAGFEVGADDYITKPYDSTELFARVRTITRLNRYRRQVAERTKFQQLFDLSPNGQMVIESNGKIHLTNKKMLELLGIASANEIIHSDLINWITPERQPELVTLLDELWKNPDHDYQIETWLARPDQAPQPVELFLGMIEFAGQAMAQVIVIDVQERIQLAGDLARERTLLGALLNNLSDFVYLKNLESRYVLVNPALASFFGLKSPQEAVGKTDFDFYPRELALRYFSDEQQLLNSGKPILGQEEPAVDARGKRVVVAASKMILLNKKREAIGILGIERDLTGQKKFDRELSQARHELAAAEKQNDALKKKVLKAEEEKDLFLAFVGLQAARLGQEIELQVRKAHKAGGQPQAGQAAVSSIGSLSAQLSAFAKDLSEYSGQEKNPGARSLVPFSLAGCVQNAVTQVEAEVHPTDSPIEIAFQAGLPDPVMGDHDSLYQVLVRLLKTVLKHIGANRLLVSVEQENYTSLIPPVIFHIHVAITCPQLSLKREEIPHLFQPYRLLFGDEKDTGLDLAICKRLVERAGGGIWTETNNANGQGLAFHFTYPLQISGG